MLTRSQQIIRLTLGVLLAFAALNAFAGGYYALAGAEGVPTEWLNGSPFESYFIPGLILFIVVGGAFLIAAIAVLANLRFAKLATYSSFGIVSIWLIVQIMIIGYVSWMQPVTAAVSLLTLGLASMLPRNAT